MFRIWLDADSCPGAVRGVIKRAAEREKIECIFVANRPIPFGRSDMVKMSVVSSAEGAADDNICEKILPGDLAVTRDIPLAARLLDRGAVVMNDRGEQFTVENIREKLSLRDFMYEMRFSGITEPGNRQFGLGEVKKFAACFDRELRKLLRKQDVQNDKA